MASTSYKGVCYDKLKDRWKARVNVNGKRVSVGYYDTPEAANEAVLKASGQPIPMFPEATLVDEPPQVVMVSAEQLPMPANYQELVERAQRTTTVAQHNLLIGTPTTNTLLEARIFCLMLRCIRKGDTEAPTAVIPIGELFPSGILGGHQHQLLEAAMLRMMRATIRIPELNEEDVHLVSLCDSMRYDSTTRILVATFGKAVVPYLINLVGNFAVADVNELMAIKSHHAHRLYWLMRSCQFKSPHTMSIERLKEVTDTTDSYKEYSDFRSKVLDRSVTELNELSFDITYTERRQRGRAVTNITFNIGSKPTNEKQLALPLEETTSVQEVKLVTPLQEKVATRLGKLKLTETQISKVLKVLVTETELTKLLKETYPVLRDFETRAKPGENVAAATMTLLKSTFPAIWAAK